MTVKGLEAPGELGGVFGCRMSICVLGSASAGAEVLSLSSVLGRCWVLLQGLVRLDGSFGCSQVLQCGFVTTADVKPRHTKEILANHSKFDTSFLDFGPPLPASAAAPCFLH